MGGAEVQVSAWGAEVKSSRPAVNFCVSCLFLFLGGSLYAIGVFALPVEAVDEVRLGGVWASATGALSLIGAVGMIATGIYIGEEGLDPAHAPLLHSEQTPSKTRRARRACLAGSVSFSGLFVASYGVRVRSANLVRLGIATLGIPASILYLIPLELLVAWMPHRPGLAVGCGQVAFGLGTAVFPAYYDYLIRSYDCTLALNIACLSLAFPVAVFSFALQWPVSQNNSQKACSASTDEDIEKGEYEPLAEIKIPWQKLPLLGSFWMYMVSVFTAQLGFALIPYFFKMTKSFGQPLETGVQAFQIGQLVSTVSRFGAGFITDVIGSKSLMAITLCAQSALFLLLIPIANGVKYYAFVWVVLGIFITFAWGACEAAVLARDVFGDKNSSTVFGVGGGITMGLGEAFSVALVSWVEGRSVAANASHALLPQAYNMFYALAAVLTAGGVLATLGLGKYRVAFPATGRRDELLRNRKRTCIIATESD